MPSELMYQIALTQVPMIGDVTIRKLLDHFPTATAIFQARRHELERIEQVGSARAAAIKDFTDFREVEQELRFIEENNIQVIFYGDEKYPGRLRTCLDAPALLYFRGNASLNAGRMVSIVGTRQPSAYGIRICEQLVKELCSNGVTIVSGLAYGVDVLAHATAVAAKAPTIGVLAHGLDRMYPAAHSHVAASMEQCGGLLTEYPRHTPPDKQHFPRRNRIVAGLADATIVIESGMKGGSLITAAMAGAYNRDVFCFPGRAGEWYSAGCHELIRKNKAVLITCAADVMNAMGWERTSVSPVAGRQPSLFVELSPEERTIMQLFQQNKQLHLEDIYVLSRLSGSQIAVAVFNLEMQCLVRCLPGQIYEPVI